MLAIHLGYHSLPSLSLTSTVFRWFHTGQGLRTTRVEGSTKNGAWPNANEPNYWFILHVFEKPEYKASNDWNINAPDGMGRPWKR